jgi:hypothetical protein
MVLLFSSRHTSLVTHSVGDHSIRERRLRHPRGIEQIYLKTSSGLDKLFEEGKAALERVGWEEERGCEDDF